jgi:hypothetical protein
MSKDMKTITLQRIPNYRVAGFYITPKRGTKDYYYQLFFCFLCGIYLGILVFWI